jgi:hypothetical protein
VIIVHTKYALANYDKNVSKIYNMYKQNNLPPRSHIDVDERDTI